MLRDLTTVWSLLFWLGQVGVLFLIYSIVWGAASGTVFPRRFAIPKTKSNPVSLLEDVVVVENSVYGFPRFPIRKRGFFYIGKRLPSFAFLSRPNNRIF